MKSPEFHFIISAPRSGSTWLMKALNGHPEIFATEQRLFGLFCEMWPNNNGGMAPRITFDAYVRALSVHYSHDQFASSRTEFADRFLAEYLRFLADFAAAQTGKRIIVDKITPYPGTANRVVEQIGRFCPDSKVFLLTRDGRDVATSGTFDWLLKDAHGTPRHRHFVQGESSDPLTRFFDDDVLTRWATTWKEVCGLSETFEPACEFQFEAMLADQGEVIGKLCSILGIDTGEDVIGKCVKGATFQTLTGRQPGDAIPTEKQRSGTSGDWRNWFTRQDGILFQQLAGRELCSKGYEPDGSWIESLPEQLSLELNSVGRNMEDQ